MGGLGPGIGGLEILVIGLVALLVVGPKDLPVLMRKVGKAMARARAMANEFRSSFDEMARQSELDELRKEVEALRTGRGMVPLGAEADAAFRDIRDDLNKPLLAPAAQPALTGPDEWPDGAPVMEPLEPVAPAAKPKAKARPKAGAGPAKATAAKPATKRATKTAAPEASIKAAGGKSRPIRARKVDL
ncbi:Sec-independent protein translocase protein TatB [Brevundimonas sp.]|uniref:Sec-independent protein translocase protein TatB n=1 Tax=Brevundimonas sp. TaxID=1871086 RepID=UPI002D7606A9|nr:Sec-independent protein translocase protein TatB [Brevundimonas sp.]HYC68040.1 Sec-independent protein translocase protein TatB [Brevundimonas sp.]